MTRPLTICKKNSVLWHMRNRYVTAVVYCLSFFFYCPVASAFQDLDALSELFRASNESLLELIDNNPKKRDGATKMLWIRSSKHDLRYLSDKAIPIFTKTLSDPDPEIRRYTCALLSRFGANAAPAVSKMADLLRDGNVEVRRGAALALFALGETSKGVIPALTEAFKDMDLEVQVYSAGALIRLGRGNDLHLTLMTNMIRAEDEKQYDAALYVCEVGGVRTLPPLTACLKDKNWEIRLRATGGLAAAFAQLVVKKTTIPDEGVMALALATKDSNEDVAANAIYALSQGKGYAKKAIPDVINCLKDTRRSVRMSAAGNLKDFGSYAKIAIPHLTEMASKEVDPIVRRDAESSIAALEKLEDR
jgi:hypothetical protein